MLPIKNNDENKLTSFLVKLWSILEDDLLCKIICWDLSGKSFHIWDVYSFCEDVLPRFFKHKNMASFVRQLNLYGFKKITAIDRSTQDNMSDHMHFAHSLFIRDHPHLLKQIKRNYSTPRRAPNNQQQFQSQQQYCYRLPQQRQQLLQPQQHQQQDDDLYNNCNSPACDIVRDAMKYVKLSPPPSSASMSKMSEDANVSSTIKAAAQHSVNNDGYSNDCQYMHAECDDNTAVGVPALVNNYDGCAFFDSSGGRLIGGEQIVAENGERMLLIPEAEMQVIIDELNGLHLGQTNTANQVNTLSRENEMLWNEMSLLRNAYDHQIQNVSKLVQFLVKLVRPAASGNAHHARNGHPHRFQQSPQKRFLPYIEPPPNTATTAHSLTDCLNDSTIDSTEKNLARGSDSGVRNYKTYIIGNGSALSTSRKQLRNIDIPSHIFPKNDSKHMQVVGNDEIGSTMTNSAHHLSATTSNSSSRWPANSSSSLLSASNYDIAFEHGNEKLSLRDFNDHVQLDEWHHNTESRKNMNCLREKCENDEDDDEFELEFARHMERAAQHAEDDSRLELAAFKELSDEQGYVSFADTDEFGDL